MQVSSVGGTRGLLAGLLLLLLGSVGVRAQTAALEGQVTDAQDAAVAGATVTATAPGVEPIVTTTDATGTYRFASLSARSYALTVSMPGFRTERRAGLALRAGETLSADVRLGLAAFAQQVDVIGVAPTPGGGVSRDRVPATVSVVTAAEIEDRHAASLADALNEQLGSITLEGATTNLFQPTLRFRGFTASPLLGLPQGVAVYQNGVRVNEPFGDTVQFDLIPQFAVGQVQLSAGAEPTYGLNALGGAMVLNLKNGFEHAGFRGEFSGGSFDRYTATAEWGANNGPWAVHLGATRFDETGWRVASPSEVTQAVADLAYRDEAIDAGVSFTYADSRLNGNAPAPVELLDAARGAVFTYPDTTENRLGFVQGRFDVTVSRIWSVQATGYYRDLDRKTLNGDEAEFEACDDDLLPFGAPAGTLCFGADADDDEDPDRAAPEHGGDNGDDDDEARPLVDVRSGRFITRDDAEGDAAFNRNHDPVEGVRRHGAGHRGGRGCRPGERPHAGRLGRPGRCRLHVHERGRHAHARPYGGRLRAAGRDLRRGPGRSVQHRPRYGEQRRRAVLQRHPVVHRPDPPQRVGALQPGAHRHCRPPRHLARRAALLLALQRRRGPGASVQRCRIHLRAAMRSRIGRRPRRS